MLDTASVRQPENFRFPWTSGLLYLRLNLYDEAIESLSVAGELAPEEVGICYNLGLCYYNRGVEINDAAQKISVNVEYLAARKSALEQFSEAVNWLEKAHNLDPDDQQTILKLYQLYYWLQMTEKQKSIELLIR
jgi:tetratricopeptide (TPR) repeat protein